MDKDTINKRYLSDNRRYADLINGFVFHGEQAIVPDTLMDMDSQTGIWKENRYTKEGRKVPAAGKSRGRGRGSRDLVRKAAIGINFAVIGIEKQEEVHYLMPLRAMGYDAAEYERQAAGIGKEVRRLAGINSAEFLSGFRKDSRLYPCITLVLYFGEEWDGSRDLHGIINFKDIPEKLKGLVNNYHLHLLDVRKLEDTKVFRTDLKQVFDFIRYSKNKEKLGELVMGDNAYRAMEEDAYDMIAIYANAKELTNVKASCRKKGKINMCKALKEMIEDGKKEGIEKGMEKGIEKGMEKGLKKGIKRGQNRINSLNLKLVRDGRTEDLMRSFQDMKLQKQLLREYNL